MTDARRSAVQRTNIPLHPDIIQSLHAGYQGPKRLGRGLEQAATYSTVRKLQG
jgi:hypothetical protein